MRRVCVVVPAYNPGHFLREALGSVVSQSWPHWECVVVDDGSDQSLSWVTDIDPRIRLVRQENQGPTHARNRGIRETDGPLIAFLDQDDSWEPEKLKSQVLELERTGSVLASTDFRFMDEQGLTKGDGYTSRSRTYRDLLHGNGICTSTVMTTRDAMAQVGGFDPQFRGASDWDAWLRIARLGRPLVHLNRSLARYRRHGDSMSAQYASLWAASVRVLGHHLGSAIRTADWDAAGAAIEGVADMGRLYGAQAYDAFREHRKVADLALSLGLSPGYTAGALTKKLRPSRR